MDIKKYAVLFIHLICLSLLFSIMYMPMAYSESTLSNNSRNIIFHDDCTNISYAGWTRDSDDSSDNFIGDSTESARFNQVIPSGQYMIYGTNYNSVAGITKNLQLGSSSWSVQYDAKISNLQFPSQNNEWRGFCVVITANNKEYRIDFNSLDDNGNLMVYVKYDNDAKTDFYSTQIHGVSRTSFHNYKISYDGDKKITIYLDNKKAAEFSNINCIDKNAKDSISICSDMCDSDHDINKVYLTNLNVIKGYSIINCSRIPEYSGSTLKFVANTSVDDKSLLSSGKLYLKASLVANDGASKTITKNQTQEAVNLDFDSVSETGDMRLVIEAYYNNKLIDDFNEEFELMPGLNITPESSITSEPQKMYWFSNMENMLDSTGKSALDSGWTKSTINYSNENESKVLIKSTNMSKPLVLPAKLNGWFSVYVGYETSTDGFNISFNGNSSSFSTNSDEQSSDKFLKPLIKEKFAGAYNFNNNSFTISPLKSSKNALKLSYIKLIGLTPNQISLYTAPDTAAKSDSLIYDNDGYTGFFNGNYPSVNALKVNAVDKYLGFGASEINWSLGGTGFLNYNSKYAGNAYFGTEKYNYQLRNGDKTAKEEILNILSSGKSPLQIVADEGKNLGMNVTACLRMDSFYNPNQFGFLNGLMYDYYKQYCLQDGSSNLSYYYPEFRDYIENILCETASFNNVSGVTLDFCRYPNVMGNEAYSSEKVDIMNQFMKELRAKLPKNKLIAVRVPCDNALSYGLDVNTWIKEGLIDRLIPSVMSYENFYSIKPWVDMVKGSNVKLYICITPELQGRDITQADEFFMKLGLYKSDKKELNLYQYLYRAYDIYNSGADGIFLFNVDSPSPQYSILGDKNKIFKWHEFEYPTELLYNSIYIKTEDGYKTLYYKDNVPLNKVWTIKFNSPVSPQCLNNITVVDENGNNANCLVSFNNSNDTITVCPPSDNYKSGESYYLILNDMQDESGNKMKLPLKMCFTVQ